MKKTPLKRKTPLRAKVLPRKTMYSVVDYRNKFKPLKTKVGLKRTPMKIK